MQIQILYTFDVLVDYVVNAAVLKLYHAAPHDSGQKRLVGQKPFAGCIILGIGAAFDVLRQ